MAVQHSGFIICSFVQVNRTKLTLINLTSNYTLNRQDAPGHAPFPAENGQIMKPECWTAVGGASGRDFRKISPKPSPLSVLSWEGGVARGVRTVECIVAS